MKNLLLKLTLLVSGTSILFSCSSSDKVTANTDKGPQYTYRKVYEGNRVYYRDIENTTDEANTVPGKKEASESYADRAADHAIEEKNSVRDMPVEATIEESPEKESLIRTFATNYRQIHSSLISGDFLTKINQRELMNSAEYEDDKAAVSSGDIFAILGFVFGVVGFVGSGVGIAASILGLIFSILGLNSSLRIFALIGLIVSVVSLIFAIV